MISLKEMATMAIIVKMRSLLFSQLDQINTKVLPYFSLPEEITYNENLRILTNLTNQLKSVKSNLSAELHDLKRWHGLILRILNEAEHYQILLETSFSEHCSLYHELGSSCPCWSLLLRDLRNECGYLRKRLF